MKSTMFQTLLLLFLGVMLLSGCAVENEQLVKIPFFKARSDMIPGLDSPHTRKKAIREKGIKGASASETEQEILAAQLVYEYQTSPDPNMRREAVDALAKIPHPLRDKHLRDILQDANPFVRLSALEALGNAHSGGEEDWIGLLIKQMQQDSDKDVRIAAVRILGEADIKQMPPELQRKMVLVLGEMLHDRVPAVRYETMQSLYKISGQDFGNDIELWIEYIQRLKGDQETV